VAPSCEPSGATSERGIAGHMDAPCSRIAHVTSPSPAAIGQRIAAARARAALTQAALASEASLDRSALAKIETGSRRVSAVELARVANALNERIEWFLMEELPSIVSHRNLQDPDTASPAIDRTVERAAKNVEFLLEHGQLWSSPPIDVMPRPSSSAEAEESAHSVRQALGLDEAQPLLDISAQAARLGLLIFAITLDAESADAAMILLERGGVAVLNGSLHDGRRRIAAAHELGHFLFADDYSVDWRIGEHRDDAVWEVRLDRFARAALLPEAGMRLAWENDFRLGEELRRGSVQVASRYRVDMSTLSRRLLELRLADQDQAERIRTVRTTRADIIEMDLLVAPEMAPPSLPRLYEAAVLRLYRTEVISTDRAIDLLWDAWAEADLPPLPDLPENTIWQFI
jgi:Zn-dependent peptidase ImmA (M78 family)/transcriptional regulator with XRE-family HTH domain